MKSTWIHDIDQIAKLFNVHDPAGLIGGGAPDDEYEQEALEVFLLRKNGTLSKKNAEEAIKNLLRTRFGADIFVDNASIEKIAHSLFM